MFVFMIHDFKKISQCKKVILQRGSVLKLRISIVSVMYPMTTN